jgi:multimeric flavodoxin WrbA
MKVLGIYGSPRKNGNSDRLLDSALQGAASQGAEVARIYARETEVLGCRSCGGCNESGLCIVKDPMQELYPLLLSAQAIIIATPIYFYAMPAQLKAIIDRAQAPWNGRRLTKPKEHWKRYDRGRGYLIAVGATKGKQLFAGVELTTKYYFDALDMSYEGGLLFREIEAKGAVQDHPDALAQASQLGKRIGIQEANCM